MTRVFERDVSSDADVIMHLDSQVSIESSYWSKAGAAPEATQRRSSWRPQRFSASGFEDSPGSSSSDFRDLVQRECLVFANWIAMEHELRMTAGGRLPHERRNGNLAQAISAAPASNAPSSPWREWEHSQSGPRQEEVEDERAGEEDVPKRPKSIRVRASSSEVEVADPTACGASSVGPKSVELEHSTSVGLEQRIASESSLVASNNTRTFVKLHVWEDCSSQGATCCTNPTQEGFLSGLAAATAAVRARATGKPERRTCTDRCIKCCIIDPDKPYRVFWDIIGVVSILYESLVLPMHFLNIPESEPLQVMTWTTRVFWTLDLPITFITAYNDSTGNVEKRPKKIALRYLKSWFLIDLGVLIADWLEPLVVRTAKMGKILKSLRLIRQARVCRILRHKANVFPGFLRSMVWSFHSGLAQIIMALLRMLVFLMWLIHVIACCWYAVADMSTSEVTWLTVYGTAETSLMNQYLTSYHWALANFSGVMEINPQNTAERAFTVFTSFSAFVIAAWVVSSITTSMTRLEVATAQEERLLFNLQELLLERKIPNQLAIRVQRNVKYTLHEQKKNEPNIQLMNLISEPLRVELDFEVHVPFLKQHPFFKQYTRVCPAAMHQVCHVAIGKMFMSAGDVLFMEGEAPHVPHMYFVCGEGRLLYARNRNSRSQLSVLTEGFWACEATLWTKWVHYGSLVARGDTELLALDAEQFQKIATASPSPASKYCDGFIDLLNSMDVDDLSDVAVPEMDLEELAVETFPQTAARSNILVRAFTRQVTAIASTVSSR